MIIIEKNISTINSCNVQIILDNIYINHNLYFIQCQNRPLANNKYHQGNLSSSLPPFKQKSIFS